MRPWLAWGVLWALLATIVGCGEVRPGDSPQPSSSTGLTAVAEARSGLRNLIEDVTAATAYRYGLTDDLGHEMDTVKILAIPESGGFVGLYHSYRNGTFNVHLATSIDLMHWTWRVRLATQASMPTIKPASDGGYAVAWEQEPDNHLEFAYYPGWPDLLAGTPSKTFEPAQQLSDCAEGTPNLYSASSTFLDVGFHFFDDCDTDRQARGTTDWSTFTAAARPDIEDAVRANGVAAGVGDRDVIDFDGVELTLIEGMRLRDDWRTWRVYLYDDATAKADQLEFRTNAGSTAFTNPTIAQVEIDGQRAILVTLFVPQEGARGGEAGELIYYRTFDPLDSG